MKLHYVFINFRLTEYVIRPSFPNGAFHKLEDHLRASDMEKQKRNHLCDAEAEAGLDLRGADPFERPD